MFQDLRVFFLKIKKLVFYLICNHMMEKLKQLFMPDLTLNFSVWGYIFYIFTFLHNLLKTIAKHWFLNKRQYPN